MTFCSDAGRGDELLRRFSSLELQEKATSSQPQPNTAPLKSKLSKDTDALPNATAATSLQDPTNAHTLSVLMAALRKLREGIVASKRTDDFAAQAYLFCIRLSILVKQPESYHPAILHLLRSIHPRAPLSNVELHEVVGYLMLDAACRRQALAEAYALRRAYKTRDAKIDAALSALAHDNYVMFHRVRKSVDGHRARLMEWAEKDLRLHTLKCFGRSYMSVDLGYLEESTNSNWEQLVKADSVGWELDGQKVAIRKIRAK